LKELLLNQTSITNIFPDYIVTGICYVLAFAAIIILFYWLGKLLNKAINITPARLPNHLFGGLFGILKWILLLSLLFTLLIVFDPGCKIIGKQTRQKSVLFGKVGAVVPALYPYVKNYMKSDHILPSDKDNKEKKKESPTPQKEDYIAV
jgi:membrane protein required for colicin V production